VVQVSGTLFDLSETFKLPKINTKIPRLFSVIGQLFPFSVLLNIPSVRINILIENKL